MALFLTAFETVEVETFGRTEEGVQIGPFLRTVRQPVGVSGIGDWQAIDLGTSADQCVVWTPGPVAIPDGALEFDPATIVTRQNSNVLRSRFGVSKAVSDSLIGSTYGEAFMVLMDVQPAPRNGRQQLRCGPILLRDEAG